MFLIRRALNRRPRKTAMPVTTPLCTTCSALNFTSILSDGLSFDDKISLGSLAEILRRADDCRFCRLAAALFRRRWFLDAFPNADLSGVNCSLYAPNVGALADPSLDDRKRCHRLRFVFSDRPTDITEFVLLTLKDLTPEIQLLEEDAHRVRRATEIHGRRVGDVVDMGRVKRWIALCEHAHGHACATAWWNMNRVTTLPPSVRMLDVLDMALVQAPSDGRYVALSYVWGTAGDSYWTTTANLDSRMQPGGLHPSILPGTIMDSVQVTRALGERYIWIDALCIVQDSPDDKNDQIHAMELIYGGALLTIVAAGGESARARLPGVFAGTRDPRQYIDVIEGLHLAVPLPSLAETIAESAWNTRGWTYQELVLSRRRLFFTRHQVYFECAKDVWCEDLVAESETLPYSLHPMRYSGSEAKLFMTSHLNQTSDYNLVYTTFVEKYTQRHLTYPSDLLDAATAVTAAMIKGFGLGRSLPHPEDFRYGMQIWDLNHSLLWQPRLDSAHARRVSSDTGVSTWPSWTWAGWLGAIAYCGPAQLRSNVILMGPDADPTESLVQGWYIVDDDRQLIRLQVKRIPFMWVSDPGEKVVVRPRYLIPEGVVDAQSLCPLPPIGTLVFRTQCALFQVSKMEDVPNGSESLPHVIFDIFSDIRQPSARVGRLILPARVPSLTVFKFIVLSRYSQMQGLYDETVYGDQYSGCLLHVMAVKCREGGDTKMWERVGLGVICEQAWLECGAEVKTVCLG